MVSIYIYICLLFDLRGRMGSMNFRLLMTIFSSRKCPKPIFITPLRSLSSRV